MNSPDWLEKAEKIISTPIGKLAWITGTILLLGSFCNYDKTNGFALHGEPHWTMLVLGGVFIALSSIASRFRDGGGPFRGKLDYKKGVSIKRGGLDIVIKEGQIENITDATRNSAIVLPTVTNFDADCLTDQRSALGAFCVKHFPDKLTAMHDCMRLRLDSSGIKVDCTGAYPPGTTILLPEEYAKPAKLLITVSTISTPADGVTSNPHIVCNCVEAIFSHTKQELLDTVNMPILGSGHGGIDRGLALLFLLLAISHFSKTSHHVKRINILVHPRDVESLNDSEEARLIAAF